MYSEQVLYNSRIIDIYIRYLRKHYPDVDIQSAVSAAGMKMYEVNDPGHWFSQRQIDLFYGLVQKGTNNPNLAREAGRYAASVSDIGHLKYWILSLFTPARAFSIINQASSLFTRSAVYESRKLGPNKVEVVVTPRPSVREKPFQCENRLGFFEAIISAFKYHLHRVEHPECLFRGDSRCRYIISWKGSRSSTLFRAKRWVASSAIFLFVPFIYFYPQQWYYGLFSASLIISIFQAIVLKAENTELRENMDIAKTTGDQLIDQVDVNYRNSLLTYEIGAAVTKQTNKKDIVKKVVELLEDRLDYDRGMILLADENKSRLEYISGYGYTSREYIFLKNANFNLFKSRSKGVFVVSFHQQEPFLVNEIEAIESSLSERSLEFARHIGAKSFICCPILYENESLGILAVDNKVTKKALVERDVSLLMGIAHFVGVSLHNNKLFTTKELQFKSLIRVLAASIDARDPTTSGHSEKVAQYSRGICQELGLPETTNEVVYIAALLHDYGKIGVPDAILKKPGPLTQQEYGVVQLHAEQTRSILRQIMFEGIFEGIPDIAAAHHERIDGSGYPLGLSGEAIPFEARIIAVADFFEALTSVRPYREPLSFSHAFELLERGKGIHFDPEVVEALRSYTLRQADCD
ncbi:HD domain-containing phosphohydrolase [Desulfohalobium retbaense]|uniref:Metal dependent phosphohydrolase n=1 Tax=Desulfohalobium retbaense (strain ATCC 49708 / DSM 5692 / JCM 16813 / HR100) TaxID=485915 RepID=C8X1L0_DESRD|nr:HD domain-containing phosphohydrolase [Desulfohalobium retbaense]ACV68307.1 metal dependent phosphohydrolase [Desulfohalobium retbaense DSM 5692]